MPESPNCSATFHAIFREETAVFKATMDGTKRTATLAINGDVVPLGADITINGETYYIPGTEDS